ncbi:MAG: TolC family protein [Deltaproteobacteria bacterium]|nr:TolC family protein [Deltaproteobacteria bacterium]
MFVFRLVWLCLVPLSLVGAARAEPIVLTPQEAVRRALAKNLSLELDRLDPNLTDVSERIAEAAFQTELFGSADVVGSPGSVSAERIGLDPVRSTNVAGEIGLRKSFSVGTTLEGRLSTQGLFGGGKNGLDPAYETGLYLQARQALLRGLSRTANEASLTNARLTRESAAALLRRQAELVAASTLKAYWDLRATYAKLAIERAALQSAEEILRETEALIGAGKLPESEKMSAAYAVQLKRRSLLQAEQSLANARDRMARIIGAVEPSSLATPELVPASAPRRTAPASWTLEELQRRAVAERGDFRALLLATKMRRTEENAAAHRLLPKLDLVAGLQLVGLSGDAGAGTTSPYGGGYGSSYAMKRVGWSAGLTLDVPLGNLDANARRDLAGLQVRRAELSERIATQDLSLELNLTWRSLQLARQQLRLSEESAKVAEAKLANETERYKVGKITAHILSSVQIEAVTERLAREQALADLVKAVVDMQAASGGLLDRLGLSAEGEAAP